MPDVALSNFVTVSGRFHRSAHLSQDFYRAANIESYIVTSSADDFARRIIGQLHDPFGARAWSLTGPYGSGKSSFALFLSDVLCRQSPGHPHARTLRADIDIQDDVLLPILIVGRRAPLVPTLLSTLADAIEDIDCDLACRVRSSLASDDAESVATLFIEAIKSLEETRFSGLFIVIDEFGKFLEYASLHGSSNDLYALQLLAEAAARNPGRLMLVTVLHTAFSEYFRNASEAQRVEWQKIQGRFNDLPFYLPVEPLIRLVAAAINAEWPEELEHRYSTAIRQVLQSPALQEASTRLPVASLLLECLPLHPLATLVLWPLFRSKMAQNERSLFAFLTSHEPHGFMDFCATAKWEGGTPPFFGLPDLYDYVTAALGAGALIGDKSRRWAEVGYALDRIPSNAPPGAEQLIKAIGLLQLYGQPVGLHATRETIPLVCADYDLAIAALDYLVRAKFVVFRRHENAYALWEGSDVDLEGALREASLHTGSGNLAHRLKSIIKLRPWIARAHYIRTGTLRYFGTEIIQGGKDGLGTALQAALPGREPDGMVYFVLTEDAQERESLIADAAKLTARLGEASRPTVLAFPRPLLGIEEAVRELEAWQWIRENVAELTGDPVAREEVTARIVETKDRLAEVSGRAFGLVGWPLDPSASDWICQGMHREFRSPRDFSEWLSHLCDESYHLAPVLQNELLNREQLSSAAAKARRNLLQAALEHEGDPALGFEGSPPEATMYAAMLLKGGFHQEGARWSFGTPEGSWKPAWDAIQTFIEGAEKSPLLVSDLVETLQQKPLGLRSGPIPVLLLVFLLTKRREVALYEGGLYVPELRIEVVERLLRNPQDFALRHFRLDENAQDLLSRLWSVFHEPSVRSNIDSHDALLSVVRPLVIFAARLPAYARQSRRFDDPVVPRVRELLLRAADPYALIFEELPEALNESLEDGEHEEAFVRHLQGVVAALDRAYPSLLDEIEYAVVTSFALHGPSPEAELRQRAALLTSYATDHRLLLFLREASREPQGDWRERIARALIDGRPPTSWNDRDVATFHARMRLISADLARLEELVSAHERTGAPVIRIGYMNGQSSEQTAFVGVNPGLQPKVDELAHLVSSLLAEHGGKDRNFRLAALARVLSEELGSG